jgi:hypothetical protein
MSAHTYDAVDSLIYLDRALPLDWLHEQLADYLGDDTGSVPVGSVEDALITAVDTIGWLVRAEAQTHRDGRRRFSNGTPFERVVRYPSTEPSDDGGETPVIVEAHVQLHPSGEPTTPPNGGVWAEEVTR